MSIDKDKIKHVSKLARILVDEKKIDGLTKDLSSIFKFIEQLNELNTDKVQPLSSILDEPLRSRKDEINDGKIRDKMSLGGKNYTENKGLPKANLSTTFLVSFINASMYHDALMRCKTQSHFGSTIGPGGGQGIANRFEVAADVVAWPHELGSLE